MLASPPRPALFFDFDNTITEADVLDRMIEDYSVDERWRNWEQAWTEGRLSARACLRLQVENLRVSREALLERLSAVRIDPMFAEIVELSRSASMALSIVSDNFTPLILHILQCNAITGVPVFANDLEFESEGRLIPGFPFHDPRYVRSANAKALHLRRERGSPIVFAGDGLSDLDAALAADVVFAKHALAEALRARGVAYRPFETLDPVLAWLRESSMSGC